MQQVLGIGATDYQAQLRRDSARARAATKRATKSGHAVDADALRQRALPHMQRLIRLQVRIKAWAKVIFDRHDQPVPKGKRKRASDDHTSLAAMTEWPKRGLYAIDQLKHLSRSQPAQIVGADPGKRELLVCVDADAPTDANDTKRRKPSVRYTAAQRSREMRVGKHAAERREETPVQLLEAMQRMNDTNSRSTCFETLSSYFQQRRTWLGDALLHFGDSTHRRRKWQRFICEQRSVSDFVRRIRGLQRDANVPLVLAYGAWASVAGRPGACCNRGTPPCIGIGLRKKLSHHFCALSTPESYTSKTCSVCGGECGPCKEVDAARRVEMIASAGDEEAKLRRARHYSVRGLRRCCNNACLVHLNRDYNAAINIQRRCMSLLAGEAESRVDATDEQLDALEMQVRRGG